MVNGRLELAGRLLKPFIQAEDDVYILSNKCMNKSVNKYKIISNEINGMSSFDI